jgi:hypothetical protein
VGKHEPHPSVPEIYPPDRAEAHIKIALLLSVAQQS